MLRFPIFLTLLLCHSAAAAQAGPFTLDSAVAHAIAHNPDLQAARFSIAEAAGALRAAGRWSNPELETELKPNVRGREFSLSVGFAQRFPLTQRLRLEKAVSEAGLATAQAEVRAAERRLVTAVRTVAIKIISLRASRELKEKQIATSREMATTASKLAATAEGSPLEAAQLELATQELSLELLQLDAGQATLIGEARPLLGLEPSETFTFTGSLPEVSLPDHPSPDLTQRPEYQAALARSEAARHSIALAKANQWEDASVGVSAEVDRANDAPDGLQTDGLIGLRFSLPLPFWNKNEGKIQEAEAAAARTGKEADALAANVRAEAAAALGEMTAARRILEESSKILLPKAREIEAKFTAFHQQAQPGIQLADVLRAREKRLTIEQASVDALRSFHLARARFLAAMGQ